MSKVLAKRLLQDRYIFHVPKGDWTKCNGMTVKVDENRTVIELRPGRFLVTEPMRLAESLTYNRVLSDEEISDISEYMRNRYGI